MLGFKFQILPRKEAFLMDIALKCILDRTIEPWPVECKVLNVRTVHRGRYWLRNVGLLWFTTRRTLKWLRHWIRYVSVRQSNVYVKWFCFEVKWSEVNYVEVLGDKSTLYIKVTLYWGTWLYCDCFIWCVSCIVVVVTCCVCVSLVMCGCFGNICTCIECVLCYL